MTQGESRRPAAGRVLAIVVGLGLLVGPGWHAAVARGQHDNAIKTAEVELLSDRGSTRATRYSGTNKTSFRC